MAPATTAASKPATAKLPGSKPREALFTFDRLAVLLKHTLLNPILTLPVFLALRYTAKGQELLLLHDKKNLFSRFRLLVILAVLGRANSLLSWGANNNWKRVKFDPKGEIVVVTGGAQGIGAAIVQQFEKKGVKVVVLDIQPLSYKPGKSVYYFKCDLTSAAEIASVAKTVRIQVGDPTVLINNAGICRGRTILDSTSRDNELTFAVNSLAHFSLAREFLPAMIARNHGHVVTVASIGAYLSAPQMVDYCASKAAAQSFHEGLRLELWSRYGAPKVRTTLVSQGYVVTPLFEGYRNDSRFLLPTLQPETIADAVVAQVCSGSGGQIVLPRFYGVTTGVRGWSHWLQERLRSRTVKLMSEYKGKQVMPDAKG